MDTLIIGMTVIALVALLFLILLKITDRYRKKKLKELVEESEKYFQNLTLKEGKYLEYFENHGATVDFSWKGKGEKDPLSKVEVKKHYRFYKDRLLYVFNDRLGFKPEQAVIENKTYFVVNNKINRIEILASFEGKNHILAKYLVEKTGQGFALVIDEKEDTEHEKE